MVGDNRENKLAEYKQLADSQNVPLWVGEFGANTYEMMASTRAMFDRVPEIVGWAYWTWKKAPTKYPGLATIAVPSDWQPIAKWVSFPVLQKPTPAQTIKGMDAFVPAIVLSNTPVDMRMSKVLTLGTH